MVTCAWGWDSPLSCRWLWW